MSLLRKLGLGIATAGLAGILLGCGSDPRAINNKTKEGEFIVQTDERYFAGEQDPFSLQGKIETITTQIDDIQYGSVASIPESGSNAVGINYEFVFVICKGGDGDGLTLIYPHKSKAFKKYTPVEIKIKRLTNGKISTKLFYLKYVHQDGHKVYNRAPIEADGIIEPDGIRYLGGK